MSTSPSWFDQEKFSRLVKKVGPKTVPEPLPAHMGAEREHRSSGDGVASTAHISLVSKPPSLLSEHRALPAMPRRTTPLPSIKNLFPYPTTPPLAPPLEPQTETQPAGGEKKEKFGNEDVETEPGHETEELSEVWHKMGLLNEELAQAIHDRDQALSEGSVLREQLRQADEEFETRESGGTPPSEELSGLTKERDEAIAEAKNLREQMEKEQESAKDLRSTSQSQELTLLTDERDQARKQYVAVRKQYEDLKAEQTSKPDQSSRAKTGSLRIDSDKLVDELRHTLADRERGRGGRQ
jgi:hypothetical protein